jgi:dTDP-4-amino-4,6-dideoxygalactose transaminase
MNVQFFDLKRQYNAIKEEINDSINAVLDSQRFIMGEAVEEFEENVAKYCGSRHAVGVASGTDALLLSVRGHDISGDVLTSTFTFFATAGAVYNARANPKFVDIDPETFNIDPEKIKESLKSDDKNVEALMPVHIFGKPAEMDEIIEIAEDHDLAVIEDAAQTIGAEYNGKKIGSLGTTCFSFFPSKNLGGFGDGGLITTNDDEIAEKIRTLRVHGAKPKYYHHVIGYNSRLDAIQAAVLNVKLKYLDKWVQNRIKNANTYNKSLKDIEQIELPQTSNNEKHGFNQYTIRVKDGLRDELKDFLQSRSIGTAVYYPLPLHMQPCFSSLSYKEGDFANAELASSEVLSLPIFPELEKEEIEYTINSISEFFKAN